MAVLYHVYEFRVTFRTQVNFYSIPSINKLIEIIAANFFLTRYLPRK